MAFCLSDCAVTATFKKFFPEAKRAWSVASDHTTLREQTLVKNHLASSPGLWYYAANVPSWKSGGSKAVKGATGKNGKEKNAT